MDLQITETLESSLVKIDINHHFKVIAGPGAGKLHF